MSIDNGPNLLVNSVFVSLIIVAVLGLTYLIFAIVMRLLATKGRRKGK